MTPKTNKIAFRLLLAVLVLAFTFAACKDKKKEEKPAESTTTVQPAEPTTPGPDTARKMDAPADTAKQKPVKEPG